MEYAVVEFAGYCPGIGVLEPSGLRSAIASYVRAAAETYAS
ncbi:hypothetical protein FHX37_1685 [Haloactinospora alba]|uniref:Uncharacterized protein n=1 Tax=Haloactinospora alba TaxID=405555 RepID=A0A543NJ32_9ACTN|nr:hypothetical protein FHX37_1685 [Haloactinospora alba]